MKNEGPSRSAEALEKFERQTAWPMLVLSLAILPLLVVPLVADLSPSTESVFFTLDLDHLGGFRVGIRDPTLPWCGRHGCRGCDARYGSERFCCAVFRPFRLLSHVIA